MDHNVVFTIDENGVEASAVTTSVCVVDGLCERDPVRALKFDRPFVCIVCDVSNIFFIVSVESCK
jgi:serine protease inhibitor